MKLFKLIWSHASVVAVISAAVSISILVQIH